MKVRIAPERPMIFLGQPFTLQVYVSDPPGLIQWVSVQIVGKLRPLSPAAQTLFSDIVHRSLGGPQNAPFFGHVMSGSRQIARNVEGKSSWCVEITAKGIPPTFDGSHFAVSYQLVVFLQIEGNLDSNQHLFPLWFVSPFGFECSFETCQNDASFRIRVADADSIVSPYCLVSPFESTGRLISQRYEIDREGGKVASVDVQKFAVAGKPLVGFVSLKQSDSEIISMKIELVRKELEGVESVVCSQTIDMRFILAKRFSISVPWDAPADFKTDLMSITYMICFTFSDSKRAWRWSSGIKVYPPEFSLARHRLCPIQFTEC
jgi:hypothetical protein